MHLTGCTATPQSNLRLSCLWYIKVTPTRGNNVGYSFYGTGMMPLEESTIHPNLAYGGVQFGYSESLVRLFYPVGPTGCLIRVDEHYGGGKYQQCAKQATVKVTIWGGEAFLNYSKFNYYKFSHPRKNLSMRWHTTPTHSDLTRISINCKQGLFLIKHNRVHYI